MDGCFDLCNFLGRNGPFYLDWLKKKKIWPKTIRGCNLIRLTKGHELIVDMAVDHCSLIQAYLYQITISKSFACKSVGRVAYPGIHGHQSEMPVFSFGRYSCGNTFSLTHQKKILSKIFLSFSFYQNNYSTVGEVKFNGGPCLLKIWTAQIQIPLFPVKWPNFTQISIDLTNRLSWYKIHE